MTNSRTADLDRETRARAGVVRRFALGAGWKLLLVGVLDFLLLRVWGPNLVNLHKDWALAASLVCLASAIAATLWLAYRLWIDSSRFARIRRLASL